MRSRGFEKITPYLFLRTVFFLRRVGSAALVTFWDLCAE